MELNWSTFVLEIINFLVLVWIMKRFLYRPVLEVIATRHKLIESRLTEAAQVKEEAEALKTQYEGRLADWNQERRQVRDTLTQELDEERSRQLTALQTTLEQEKEKARVAQQRQGAEQRRAIEQHALQQGAAFSSRLMQHACGPELEDRLLTLLLDDLSQLSEQQTTGLRQQWGDAPQTIEVSTAFALSDDQHQRLELALRRVSGLAAPIHVTRDHALLAGLRIVIGAWVLAVNVRDELKGFAEIARVPR